MSRSVVLDTETTKDHDTIWLCCCEDLDKDRKWSFTEPEGLQQLIDSYDHIVGHNIIGFDSPVLSKVWDVQIPDEKLRDTLILSRLYNPELKHSLAVWGDKLGFPKGDFTDYDGGLCPEMVQYCEQDVSITKKLYIHLNKLLRSEGFSEASEALEHAVALATHQQELNGFRMDTQKATELYTTITHRMTQIREELQAKFPPIVTERWSEKTGKRLKDDIEEFNIGSRQQIAKRLESLGAKFKKKTETGRVVIDESTLADVDLPEAKLCSEYLMLQKREGLLNSWFKHCADDGRIHGRVITNGAVTGRMTHHCVPMDSEILTRNGWKSYYDVQLGEDVLAYDMETKTKKWTPLLDKRKYENAEVGSIGQLSDRKRIKCTRKHKWVVIKSHQQTSMTEHLICAEDIKPSHAIKVNAPFDNEVEVRDFRIIHQKYDYDWVSEVCKMSDVELHSFLMGFLLADGCLIGDSWTFSQADTILFEALYTCLYLVSNTRVSITTKNPTKANSKHNWSYNVTNTQCSYMRSSHLPWRFEGYEDVWCPTTKYGTWVMKQGEMISITGNSPNLGQIPSVSSEYGKDCRACFTVEDGNVLVGIDASGLELRMLAHYMRDEEYVDQILNGDIHSYNMEKAGLSNRDQAKTLVYAACYGAGDAKLGSIVGGGYKEGKALRAKMMKGIPAFSHLISKVEKHSAGGSLPGLDGRRIRVRSQHSALNTLLQGAGAVVMKKALVILTEMLYNNNIEYKLVANVHDEFQIETPEYLGEAVGICGVQAIKQAGIELGLRCPLDAEYKIGPDWSLTH